jgi:hypothetical protein
MRRDEERVLCGVKSVSAVDMPKAMKPRLHADDRPTQNSASLSAVKHAERCPCVIRMSVSLGMVEYNFSRSVSVVTPKAPRMSAWLASPIA